MRTLFEALWKNVNRPGSLTFWLNPSKTSLHVPLRNLPFSDEDAIDLAELAGDCNVYFGLGLRRDGLTEKQQGGKKDIIALPALVLDIDFYDPIAHKAQNLPKDLDEASVLIDHLPDPSAIVFTGNGVHVYWFLKEPIELDSPTRRTQVQRAYKEFHEPIIAKATERGWHLDNTASIQRVWRVPGFINQKTNKKVELGFCDDDAYYEPEDLGIKIPRRRVSELDEEPPLPPTQPASTPQVEEGEAPPDYLLARMRERLARVTPNNRFYQAVQALLKGESMANPGERDHTLQGVCSTIAWMPEGRDADPEILAELFRPSLAVWAAEGTDKTKTVDEELKKVIDKIRRSQEDYWDQQAKKRPLLLGIAKALGVSLEPEEDEGEEEKKPNEFFLKHALIIYRENYYAFDWRFGSYSKVKRAGNEILTYLRDAWANGPDEIDIEYENARGEIKQKTLPRICVEYGTNADRVIGDMVRKQSSYDPESRIFFEALAQHRVTEAVFDPAIDTWLRLMVGDGRCNPTAQFPEGRPLVDVFLDWLAGVVKLDKQNSALYLNGASGAGKGLISNGLARIWHEGPPTDFERVTGNFNENIVDCPLLWIDEGISQKHKNDISVKLRAILGRQSFELNEKFLSTRIVSGATRLIICANNENVLIGDAEYSRADLEAIVGRILHIRVQQAAADWLREHNKNGRLTREWIDGDKIAKHALWLAENRTIVEGRRFLVEGDETEMHRNMITQGDTNGLVYEWLARFASNPEPLYKRYRSAQKPPLARVSNDELLVNTEGLIDCWDLYMSEGEKPKSTRIGRVLGNLSHRVRKLGARHERTSFHVIEPDLVVEWSAKNQIGNEDKIAMNLKRKEDFDDNADTSSMDQD